MKKLIFGVLGAMALFGCGGGGGNGGGDSDSDARIAFINASPDAGTLDFYLNGSKKASNVEFGGATAFKAYTPKDYDVDVAPAGGTVADSLQSFANTFGTDTDTLVVALGLRNPNTNVDGEQDKSLVINFGGADRSKPSGNLARLIIVNGFVRAEGFGTPAVDFRNPGNNPLTNAENIAFGGFRSVVVNSGNQSFQVRRNGTEQVFIEAPAQPTVLQPGGVYIALIRGIEGSPTAPSVRYIPVVTRD